MKRSEYWLVGFVTNRGSSSWRVQELEVRFLNPEGSLLDVAHLAVHDAFVVQPGREQAFRVDLGRLPPAVVEAVVQVRVQSATDGNLPPRPD